MMMEEKSKWMDLRTCVSPEGRFVFGTHAPYFGAANLRSKDDILALGASEHGGTVLNHANFPSGNVEEMVADTIFEVANPFPFRGTTFIGKRWADRNAQDPSRIAMAAPQKVSVTNALKIIMGADAAMAEKLFYELPDPIKLAVATTSTDPEDLRLLAKNCCQMIVDNDSGLPTGLVYGKDATGRIRPKIFNHPLYEAVANNPCLDHTYKQVMVLRPGIQGGNEIVGDWHQKQSHVFEYLRRNSYIPWGHYAANMAHDAVRYAVGDLIPEDIFGMRHLYYQRTVVHMAADLGLTLPPNRAALSLNALESLRRAIAAALPHAPALPFSATLWGWNFGFDYAPSGYRLHASHQQIHQQYALIPEKMPVGGNTGQSQPAFACGDMIQSFGQQFRDRTGRPFFRCYEDAIRTNTRMDGKSARPSNLVIYEDGQVMLFVPKAQTSQWELQLMPLHAVGNILEAGTAMRHALDTALLVAMRVLTTLGATMITVIEYSKRFQSEDADQRLLYSFLPRLPESPGAFSEAQLRWINGHYPEDFAAACRLHLKEVTRDLATP
jgi:hypothetical protein